jgi:NADP-dependent 3-hydroxy acid dehydrogenase YdfG
MTRDYEGKVVVITGASGGIGAALAKELDARGARLVLVARRKAELEALAGQLGEALPVVPDVTRRDQVQRALASALERHGRVDVWVNNAGRGITRSFEQLGDDDLDAMMRDNVKSALYGMQAVLPHFKAAGQGVVANVSSMLSRVPFATIRSAYSAAKSALDSLTETLRFELARDFPGIRVVLVLPGVVATDFGANALGGGPDSRALPGAQPVTEVAKVVADGLLAGPVDVYTRPEGLERVLGHLRALAAAPAIGA